MCAHDGALSNGDSEGVCSEPDGEEDEGNRHGLAGISLAALRRGGEVSSFGREIRALLRTGAALRDAVVRPS